jgi:hypothetical protein
MGIHHTLLSTGMCGILQSLVGGQPLLIVGVAEPIVIIYHFMNEYCTRTETDLVIWSAWACTWAALFLTIMSVTNLCSGIKWFTRISGETFGMLIAILFLQQAIKGLVEEFDIEVDPVYWKTLNGVFGLLLAFMYVWSSHTLSQARTWRFGLSFIRAVIADYGFAIMIIAMSGISFTLKGNDAVPQRILVSPVSESTWLTSGVYTASKMTEISGLQILAAVIPGFVISVLFYFDHSVSSQLAQQKEFNVKRPSAYHYDLLLLALMTVLCGLLGLPPVNGVLPQAPLHTKALCAKVKMVSTKPERQTNDQEQQQMGTEYEKEGRDIKRHPLVCYENRISNFAQALLCLVLFGVAPFILKFIPTSIIWSFFAFMSLESLPGNQLFDRIQIIMSGKKRRYQYLESHHALYLETVKFSKIVIFTLIQITLLLSIWAITVWTGLFGISFPLWIMGLVPFRMFVLPRIFTESELNDLDCSEVEELPAGVHNPKMLAEESHLDESFHFLGGDSDGSDGLPGGINATSMGHSMMGVRHTLTENEMKKRGLVAGSKAAQ